MKNQYVFHFDSDRCIKCKSCEVACKQWKNLPAGGLRLRRVEEVTSGTFPEVKRQFFSIACQHCAEAPCIEVCLTKAIIKKWNGSVVVEAEKCIGCRACLEACPFGIPQFDEKGIMQKCDMCQDRLELGQAPMCATTCPTQALKWGTVEDMERIAGQKASK